MHVWLQVMYEEASQVANDAVSSIRTVASFCAEQKVIDTYRKKCEGPMKNGVRQGLVSGMGFGMSNVFLFGTYSLCFYVGARFVHNGTATFGQVFKVGDTVIFLLKCWFVDAANHVSQALLVFPHFIFSPWAGFLCFNHGSTWSFTIECICPRCQ